MRSEKNPPSMRVVHVITSLQTGGAEAMLARLVAHADKDVCESLVVCLGQDGQMGARVRAARVPLIVLAASVRWSLVRDIFSVLVAVFRWKPTLVQGWMYHGNVAAFLLKVSVAWKARLLWNIRCTLADEADFPRMTRWVMRANALLSRMPALVIFNSRTAVADHLAYGFKPREHVVLPNGFDVAHFAPNAVVRRQVREMFAIPDSAVVVGLVARYHPMKDFPAFARAMNRVTVRDERVRILLAGPGVDASNDELRQLLVTEQLESKTTLAGECPDVATLLPGLDVFCLSSAWGEAFPNILGEAMSCGVPCVATDVGDSADILGDCGVVVQRRNVDDLSAAIAQLCKMPADTRRMLGQRARDRIAARYNIVRIVEEYMRAYMLIDHAKR